MADAWFLLIAALALNIGSRLEEEPRWNLATVMEAAGVVTDVREVSEGAMRGIYLTMRTDDDNLDVYVGPAEYVKSFDLVFKRNDRVHLDGSKVRTGAAWLVLAREVRRDELTLYLRDKQGRPFWSTAPGGDRRPR